ncbi:MAG TPA: response regulator transcription factor, partial [Flavobacteriales bacterium]|nr:response regulator transcription factor [Flavobacteriales bacterium]
ANGLELKEAMSGGPEVEIAIVDLNMPVMNGYETIAWIHASCPGTRPIALTFDGTGDAVIKAVRNGARGFILKDIEPTELKLALDSVAQTGYYHTDLVNHSLLTNFDNKTSYERQKAKVMGTITPRELEFLKLVCSADEPTYERIAEQMVLHRRTVDGYREALFEKFGIRSKTGLVLFAIKWGIIEP